MSETCRCGVSGKPDKANGWRVVWNVSNGLVELWFCPDCAERLGEMVKQIEDFVGVRMGRINFASWPKNKPLSEETKIQNLDADPTPAILHVCPGHQSGAIPEEDLCDDEKCNYGVPF